MDSLGPVSRKHQDWFDENDKEIQGLLEEKHQKHKAYSSSWCLGRAAVCDCGTPWTFLLPFFTSEIPAQYLARLPIQTYARQFRRGSETCKTPG